MHSTKPKKKAILKFSKMTLLIFLLLLIVPIGSIAGYEYFKVINAPKYNPETMALNYEIVGSGNKKLVFIHGLTGSKNYWKRELETVSKTHQLLLVDLLGFGDSPKPNSDYSLNIQLNALEKIITKENFNDGNTVIVGHSMGAIISLALLAEHSNWFEGAIITGLPIYKDRNEFREIMSGHAVFDRLASGKYGTLICMLHPIFMTDYFKPDNLTDDVYEDAKKHTWQSYANSLTEVVIKPDLYAFSKAIKDKKIVFIHGAEDTSAPYETAKEYAETFSNAKFITIKDGDHQLFLKEPNILWRAIQDFSVSEDTIIGTVGPKALNISKNEQALNIK
ncbi:alpha/beta fold hydrolase [Mariniflexile sp.]|uniref:alpha/beta fold hydrolase n=1 Tax=Mariniflexile sp. TaxID=1979402 RepID=UPI0040472C4C